MLNENLNPGISNAIAASRAKKSKKRARRPVRTVNPKSQTLDPDSTCSAPGFAECEAQEQESSQNIQAGGFKHP